MSAIPKHRIESDLQNCNAVTKKLSLFGCVANRHVKHPGIPKNSQAVVPLVQKGRTATTKDVLCTG